MIEKVRNKYCDLPVQAKASLWFLLCSLLQRGISTITLPIFTRLLTTEEYGHYSVFFSWEQIAAVFVTLYLYSGVYMQGIVKYRDEKALFSSSMQGLTSTLVGLWMIVYFIFRDFWNDLLSLNTIEVLSLFALLWSGAAFSFWSAEQRVDLQYKKLVAVTLIVSVLQPIAGIYAVTHFEQKATARIVSMAVVSVIGYSGLFFYQLFRGKAFFSKKYWTYSLRLAIPLVPHYLSQSILSSSDRIMIEKYADINSAGLYNLAYSLSMLVTIINQAVLNTVNPWIFQKIKDKQEEKIAPVAYLLLILIAILNLGLISFAPEIISVFAPKEYYSSIYVIPPLAMTVFFMFSYSLFADFEFYYEKTQLISIATMLSALLNIALNWIFIQKFGYTAAAYTTLACYILYSVFHYICMVKICNDLSNGPKVYDLRILVGISASFVMAGFLIMLTYSFTIIRYAFVLILLIVVFCMRNRIIGVIQTMKNR